MLLNFIEIDLGSNEYYDLSTTELGRVKHFTELNSNTSFTYDGYLYEIDSNNIASIKESNELVWMHIWRPFCSARECQFIAPFQSKADKNGITLYMISETYDFKSLDSIALRAKFNKPLFVIRGNTFGHKIDQSRKRFIGAISKNEKIKVSKFHSDFLFSKGKLIFSGNHLLDSLENILTQNEL